MKSFEIERKFLVKQVPNLDDKESFFIKQAYISTKPTLRLRQKNDKYFFTFKGQGDIKRLEFEQEITKEEFENLWSKIEGITIIKNRYIIPLDDGNFAELDVYKGHLEGFYTVEVEFETEEIANRFSPPIWFGQDITKNYKYTNAYMSQIV